MNIELTQSQIAAVWGQMQKAHTLRVYGFSYEEIFVLARYYEEHSGHSPDNILKELKKDD